MSKNIILLSDGTGNSNIKDRGTNVFKLYEAIDFNNTVIQVAFYDDGVGTEKFKPLKILGSAFGWGLARNVRNLYKHLAQVYEAGDQIYLFGFSRGAFTVRTLAGFIDSVGILDINRYQGNSNSVTLDEVIFKLYEEYRTRNTACLEKLFYDPFIKIFYKIQNINVPKAFLIKSRIKFIGVWDTVDAVGLPFDEATKRWNKYIFRFKFDDLCLPLSVDKACHALSIDDERQSFHPLLWRKDDVRIEQVWFPGVHANVGGGYPQQGLSLVALEWMLEKARLAGLAFVQTDVSSTHDKKYALDKLYNPRSGFGVYYRYKPRNIAQICSDNGIQKPTIHVSAFQRIAHGVFDYAPKGFPSNFEVIDNAGIHINSNLIQGLVNPSSSINLISPLLNDAKINNLIKLRRFIYYIFLSYSLFTIYWIMRDDIEKDGIFSAIKVLVTPDILLEKLLSLFYSNSLITIGGVLIFGFSVYIHNKISNIFTKFWSPLRAKIKKLL